jgi:hypothetical protein
LILEGVPLSNESVVECLQRALLSVDVDGGVNMRHLCDMLLRCAVAQSYHEQVLPANKKPKVYLIYSNNTYLGELNNLIYFITQFVTRKPVLRFKVLEVAKI